MWLTKEKWISIGKGLLIAVGGAVATYLAQLTTDVDFGQLTPFVVAGLSVVINIIRKTVEKEDKHTVKD